ncbi:hypothetical protein AB0D91_45405 [Streptomyces canus]|uniref:hypothetical protein n=1 Tax=Streptomyces canus TaxID=58343 RepID=UPI0033CD6F3F
MESGTGVHPAGEHKLARRLLASLRPGMPLLVGRNIVGHELWTWSKRPEATSPEAGAWATPASGLGPRPAKHYFHSTHNDDIMSLTYQLPSL